MLVPSADPHLSEYVADCFKRRQLISGFSGSAGTALIDNSKAFLLTDARYWAQAQYELDHSAWTLVKEGTAEALAVEQLVVQEQCHTIAADPQTITAATAKRIQDKGIHLLTLEHNPIDDIWGKQRPSLPKDPIAVLPLKFAGVALQDKIKALRTKIGNHTLIISALDEIACKYYRFDIVDLLIWNQQGYSISEEVT
jgi:Xaa-Pro aminopeptidase